MRPILSILVPTYNRVFFLSRLLADLEHQTEDADASQRLEVLIGDNCSHDATMEVAASFASRHHNWLYERRSENIGPEANMVALLKSAKGVYCWFIGDDDLPRSGLVSQLLTCLTSLSPSLLYLQSVWATDVSLLNLKPLPRLDTVSSPPVKFAARTNIWTTFISSWVFNSDTLFLSPNAFAEIQQGIGSNFVSLGWILPLLTSKGPFLASADPCIYATSGNTGNYSSLEVFGINYSRQVHRLVSSRSVANALIGPFLIGFLPGVIASVKSGFDFSPQMLKADSGIYSRIVFEHALRPSFYLLCLPFIILPSSFVGQIYPIASRLKAFCRRFRFSMGGSA